ncbi:MAG: electron transport complex subunit RsxC [Nitrospirota bacterium]|nr:electron transport complex subunit RsxC [Nitrospirota bacterium]
MIERFRSFFGGIHPAYRKELSATLPSEVLPLPEQVVLPLLQHIGMPAEAVVSVGDLVRTGQMIGRAAGRVSAPVHATLSGTVTAIATLPHPSGREVRSVVIRSDGLDQWLPLSGHDDPHQVPVDTVRQMVQEAGLAGLGGASFPTHVKLDPPVGKAVRTLIVNGVECEPYLTADHRLMLEEPRRVVDGARLVARVLGVERVLFGIEDNKPDAIQALAAAIQAVGGARGFGVPVSVGELPTKYPQGGEKQLITVLTGLEVPSGGLPIDVGVVVHNVGTCAAVFDAVRFGKPLVERIVTVTGEGLHRPGNARVRLGTPARVLVEHFGGTVGRVGKVVFGGPMMGAAQFSLEVPVIKGTSGILVIPHDAIDSGDIRPCIRCSACIEVCPIGLLPNMISVCTEVRAFAESERYHPFDCIECGCCSYVCPSYRPLVQMIRFAKTEVQASRSAQTKH